MGKPLLVEVIITQNTSTNSYACLKIFLTAIDCGQLDPPANGTVDTSQGSLLGAVATYSCDPSFTLVGTATRQCQEDETWSGESPTCQGEYYINIEFLDKILYKFLKK